VSIVLASVYLKVSIVGLIRLLGIVYGVGVLVLLSYYWC
jgi:hypothetical protein